MKMYSSGIVPHIGTTICKPCPGYMVDNITDNKIRLWQIISDSQQQILKTLKAAWILGL